MEKQYPYGVVSHPNLPILGHCLTDPPPPLCSIPDQLREIRRSNLARVLCDTSDDLQRVQSRPLQMPSEENKKQPCGSLALPVVDLGYWEDRQGGDDDGDDDGEGDGGSCDGC